MKKIFLSIFLVLATAAFSYAQQPEEPSAEIHQNIVLKDGTIIKGQLININNDLYTVKTLTMGEIQVKATDVQSINLVSGSSPSAQAGANTTNETNSNALNSPLQSNQFQQMQQKIMSDPEMQSGIKNIISDDQLVELLKDPGLMNDILSNDPQRIQQNPKFQQLIQHPKFQQLMNQMIPKFGVPTQSPSK